MNYNEAYNFLISLSNLPRQEYLKDSRHCVLYLKRLQFFLDILGNPEKKIPHYIHVTGTSGKGSVCLMLDSILRAAGKKVGLITSPHPSIITERWEINGQTIPKKKFAQLITKIKPKLDKYIHTSPYDMLSFFEIITALGLYYLAQKKVSWAILEVGLGGRYDSTNIIPRKDIAVITNIGLDHTDVLGRTKQKIAYEKAGIIKRGCKIFTAEKDKRILKIINRECRLQIADCRFLNNHRDVGHKILDINLNGIKFNYQNTEYVLPVLGKHQIRNAVLAVEIAKELKIKDKIIQQGLDKVKLPLRMEVFFKKPLIILDGAHNPDKMKTTIETIKTLKQIKKNIENSNLHLIVGFANDKNWLKMIKQLAVLNLKSIACTRFTNNPFRKVVDPKLIAKNLKKLLSKSKISIFLDPRDALTWSRKQTEDNDCLLVTGSFFLSGEIRHYII